MIEDMTMSLFAPLIGQSFEVRSVNQEPVQLILIEVTDQSRDDTEGFSLIFQGPKDTSFLHDTHLVNHGELGDIYLFLGPVVSQETNHINYQAIFNRPKTN